jgi:Ca2+-binding RTX toxin-like protein
MNSCLQGAGRVHFETGLLGFTVPHRACALVIAACALAPLPASATKVLEYLFDDPSAVTAIDTSGNNLHGVFMGSSIHVASSLPGHGNGVVLNGVDDFINVGDHDILDFSASYTLMAWINYRPTVEFRAELMEKGGAYWLNVRLNQRDGSDDTRQARAGGFFDPCSGVQSTYHFRVDSPAPIPENTWTHLASTYDGTSLRIYVNGQLVNTLSVQRSVCLNDNPLAIGAKYVPAQDENLNFVNGMLDDVRVFDNALSVTRIRELMNRGEPAAETLQFSAGAFSVEEGGAQASVTVVRSGSTGQVSVAYTTSGGSATAGADYAFTQGSLEWGDGDGASKTITVPVVDDGDPEQDETVTLALSNPGGGAILGAADTAVLTITDNDAIGGQVMCGGLIAGIVGSDSADTINGTSASDVIHGLGGNDQIFGRGGGDVICGGSGSDVLSGNGGPDKLFGERGRDQLQGNDGQDVCDGGPNLYDTASGCEQTIAVP